MEMELIAKPNTKAPVWEHFGFKPNDRGEPQNLCEPVCRICWKTVLTKSSNTTNLQLHLKHNHPCQYSQLGRKTPSTNVQSTIPSTFRKQTKYKQSSTKWCQLTDSVVRCLAKEMLPFNLVEKTSFKKMLQTFDSQYELPSRTWVSQTAIPQLYNKIKDGILEEIKDIAFFSATTDMWSSSNMTPYMSLTIHYVTTEWTLHSKCLETRYIPENHTADILGENLKCALADWGLDEEKLACITTDNGANIIAAVRKLGWQWLNCFGHNLHLAVSHGLDSDKDRTARAIGVCKSLVRVFNLSWLKRRDLRTAQSEANLPQHSLVLDVVTRWGSKQKMVDRVLEQLPAIRRVLVEDRKYGHLNPTWQDVSVLESINAAMKPLVDFTDILSGEKYVTVSSVKPVLELIKGDVLSPGPDDTALTTSIKQQMCRVLTEKYSSPAIQDLLRKATILDPRYRGSMEEAEALDDIKHQLVQELLELRGPEREEEEGGSGNAAEGNTDEPTVAAPTKKKRLSDILQNRRAHLAGQAQAALSKRVQVDAELTKYFQEGALDDASCDPLVWWRDNQKRFLLLANLAQKYMCICATSSSSERMFSTAGNIATPERSCLKPHKVNMLAAESSDEYEEDSVLIKPKTVRSSVKEGKMENETFLQKVREILEGLESLKKKVSDLENKQKMVLGVPLPEEGMKKDLQKLRDEIKMIAGQIQKNLKSIEPKKEEEDGKYVPINLRMQKTQHGVLSREFVELMGRCNTIQAQYRDRNVERIQRQLKITGSNVTDEELDRMLESGQTDVFTQNILSDAKATKQALNEIESRHDEILKLERSIKDLHDMFQYLAMEVEAQGEMVDRIEANIMHSTNYVENAVAETHQAALYQNKARKKKLWIALCCCILLLIVGIALAVQFS